MQAYRDHVWAAQGVDNRRGNSPPGCFLILLIRYNARRQMPYRILLGHRSRRNSPFLAMSVTSPDLGNPARRRGDRDQGAGGDGEGRLACPHHGAGKGWGSPDNTVAANRKKLTKSGLERLNRPASQVQGSSHSDELAALPLRRSNFIEENMNVAARRGVEPLFSG